MPEALQQYLLSTATLARCQRNVLKGPWYGGLSQNVPNPVFRTLGKEKLLSSIICDSWEMGGGNPHPRPMVGPYEFLFNKAIMAILSISSLTQTQRSASSSQQLGFSKQIKVCLLEKANFPLDPLIN